MYFTSHICTISDIMKRSVAVIYHTQRSCTVDEDMQQNIVTGL